MSKPGPGAPNYAVVTERAPARGTVAAMSRIPTFLGLLLLLAGPAPADGGPAIGRGLAWLAKNQASDGSWGKRHTYAVTGLACLAHLAAADEPFAGSPGLSLTRGLQYLMSHQKGGMFPAQGHTWIHGQGFATLALSEAYGRALRAKTKPDLDLKILKKVVATAAAAISRHQSVSGGWWYHPNDPKQHEGSTTVCAVQALVSASRFGIPVDAKVLQKGFDYLKRCQNPDGGFDYKEGPGTTSMKEGTAAGIATLALMRRFDFKVMVDGVKFLKNIGHAAISAERFPYYGHFYGCMGLKLFGEEMAATKETAPYIAAVKKTMLSWQQKDGAWPQKGWMVGNSGEDLSYPTAFALLVLAVPDGRLSIFSRPKSAS